MKELKELLSFSVSLLNALGHSLDDGDIDLADITKFWEPVAKASDAIDGMGLVLKEIAELDEAKKKELIDFVKKEFDIPQDKIEERVEGAINIGLSIAMYVSTFIKQK